MHVDFVTLEKVKTEIETVLERLKTRQTYYLLGEGDVALAVIMNVEDFEEMVELLP